MLYKAPPGSAQTSDNEVVTEFRTIITDCGATNIYVHTPAALAAGNATKPPLIINIHGGGFMQPYKERDRFFSRFLSRITGCTIFDIDYRLAPDFPFPNGLLQSYSAVEWAYNHADELNADKSKLILLGHSSGGNFAAYITKRAAQSGDFPVALAILDYPPLDLYTAPEVKYKPLSVSIELMRQFDDAYVPCYEERKNPDVSPVYSSEEELRGVCKTLIIACGLDCLADEAVAYGELLSRAGVNVKTLLIQKAVHGATVNFRHGWSVAVNAILDAVGKIAGCDYGKFSESGEHSFKREVQV